MNQKTHLATPFSRETEREVIGCLLTNKSAIDVAVRLLGDKSFYDAKHRVLWMCFKSLWDGMSHITNETVIHWLGKQDIKTVDITWILQLANSVYPISALHEHCVILQELATRRTMIDVFGKLYKNAYEDRHNVNDLMSEAINTLEKCKISIAESSEDIDPESSVARVMQEIEHARNSEGNQFIKTGLPDLDDKQTGMHPGDLIIYAARPGMGKTSLMLTIAMNVAKHYGDVGIASLEMSNSRLWKRLLSMEAGIPGVRFRNPNDLTSEDMERLSNVVSSDLPQIWVDSRAESLEAIVARARDLKRRNNIKLFMVDYLQLVSSSQKTGNREQEVSKISRTLKMLAKEIELPIVALAQLSRAVESRGGDRRPMLSDLRESGAIEQDADMVNFIYRPEYYNITEDSEGNNLRGIGFVIVSKNRHGELGDVKLRWNASTTSFERFSLFNDTENLHRNDAIKNTKIKDEEDVPF